MHDVRVVETTGNCHRFERITCGPHANLQAVERITGERIAMNLRANARVIGCERTCTLFIRRVEIGFSETVGRRTHRRIGASGDLAKHNSRSRVDHLNWSDNLRDAIDNHLATTVSQVSMADPIQELTESFKVLA